MHEKKGTPKSAPFSSILDYLFGWIDDIHTTRTIRVDDVSIYSTEVTFTPWTSHDDAFLIAGHTAPYFILIWISAPIQQPQPIALTG